MNPLDEISPAELLKDVLDRLCTPGIATAIRVGPLNDTDQQAGGISIMAAGTPLTEKYVPIQRARLQMRCLHGSLEGADGIAQAAYRDLHQRNRTIGRMASTCERYLIHSILITSGPSMHFDSAETWETLLFAELVISTVPL